jgi:hypothetical protein
MGEESCFLAQMKDFLSEASSQTLGLAEHMAVWVSHMQVNSQTT